MYFIVFLKFFKGGSSPPHSESSAACVMFLYFSARSSWEVADMMSTLCEKVNEQP